MTFNRASTVLAIFAVTLPIGGSLRAAAPPASAASSPAADSGYHRIQLPVATGQVFPYTVEVPAGWQVLRLKDAPGLWLGPADGKPPDDPRLIYVRISPVPLADPPAVVSAIKANDAADASWSAPTVEVREVNGVKGVLVQVDSGTGDKAGSMLTLKLPLAKTSVDFIGAAKRDEFAKLKPLYERVLFSAQRTAEKADSKPAAPKPAGKP